MSFNYFLVLICDCIWSLGPITSWQIDGEKVETVTDFLFLCSKITVDDDCRHEIKRHLHLGRQAMTNLDHVLKRRDTTLLTKVQIVKAMVFPAVMYGCESWTRRKAECQITDAFKLWCWRILKAINPDYSLEGLMLKLKLQWSGHLM